MSATESDHGFRRAKRPRSPIAGPYGHPFHATIVTIPIGAWTAAVVFDIASLLGAAPGALATGALWLVVIGVIGAVVAAVFGLLDFSQLPAGTKVRRTALWHLGFNSLAVVLFVVSAIVRAGDPDHPSVGGFILALVGILVVGVSGFLGGELAYRHGVRVADEQDQRRAYNG
ncbi:DUF2231 domain-containing protein [Leifsonia virtsii]|uniref:DUF2231 domain-containing protein n=1 Tax=Leifsonia virtsii TaxID=3035915 RepID=A0ABT8J1N1_9MICO|nr:DUF2231 domain-containing protein [Leifsonia virtsii]MDN4598867.1 DUF2231 domain-containing protein [Leifsonia virtsii]